MTTKIDTVSSRDKLKPRRAPYWHRLTKGGYLGFRKMSSDSAGTWLARYRTGDKQPSKSIGALDEYPAHERFDQAAEQARAWFLHLSRGGSTGRANIKQACADYVDHIRLEKGDKPANDIKGRFKRWVDAAPLAQVELTKATREHFREYRKTLMDTPVVSKGEERKRAPDTINRDLTALRAALNFAFSEGRVTTDFAWREALKPIKNATRRRDLYLDRDQRRRLIDHAAADLADLLRAFALLPFRPGAVAGLNAGDFDPRLNAVKVGKDKAGKDRRLIVQGVTAAFLTKHAEGKPADAPLLARADGARWNKDSWKDPIKEAVAAAGLPAKTTAYTLRHSVITDLVVGGLDLLTVAKISGTSVAMIEKHYGALRGEVAASALEKLAL